MSGVVKIEAWSGSACQACPRPAVHAVLVDGQRYAVTCTEHRLQFVSAAQGELLAEERARYARPLSTPTTTTTGPSVITVMVDMRRGFQFRGGPKKLERLLKEGWTIEAQQRQRGAGGGQTIYTLRKD